mmetsp:Transcript_16447/g.29224  ORF Transcript_16447/g.29224 Transcript_16447/m.29224 type:complete len:307 (+) Transcript_16447:324-1244(+)
MDAPAQPPPDKAQGGAALRGHGCAVYGPRPPQCPGHGPTAAGSWSSSCSHAAGAGGMLLHPGRPAHHCPAHAAPAAAVIGPIGAGLCPGMGGRHRSEPPALAGSCIPPGHQIAGCVPGPIGIRSRGPPPPQPTGQAPATQSDHRAGCVPRPSGGRSCHCPGWSPSDPAVPVHAAHAGDHHPKCLPGPAGCPNHSPLGSPPPSPASPIHSTSDTGPGCMPGATGQHRYCRLALPPLGTGDSGTGLPYPPFTVGRHLPFHACRCLPGPEPLSGSARGTTGARGGATSAPGCCPPHPAPLAWFCMPCPP